MGRMLILEDDLHVGKAIKAIAESGGLESRLLTDPDGFLSMVDDWEPTHIALDLVMPEKDGMQILAELANRNCTSKIIITSGMGIRVLDAAARAGEARGLNIIGVLAKPFSAAALRTLLIVLPAGAPDISRLAPGADARHASQELFNPTEIELRRALENQEFTPHYQPKIECATGRLAGFEALARWFHPGRGLIMPDYFIPRLDQSGLLEMLTDTILNQALSWFSQSYGSADNVTLSINFSAKTFRDAAYLDRIVALCKKYGVARERLIFELTESDSMDDPIVSLDLMTRLRMKGFMLSIDDFGTGYSSLLQLVRLPFSEIKVDKSFVMAACRSTESRTVVKSVVDLGRSLGLKSAAEGVEDLATLEYLRQIGCDLAQGYLIARPMDAAAVQKWLETRN
jgi:EAL domain-containing protein (putative c-di-GMP-specific phosphodiesterase class I)/ActR/RegA family two-component response regulator